MIRRGLAPTPALRPGGIRCPIHDLSRSLCHGKEGALRGGEFEDQLHSFSALAVLHNFLVKFQSGGERFAVLD